MRISKENHNSVYKDKPFSPKVISNNLLSFSKGFIFDLYRDKEILDPQEKQEDDIPDYKHSCLFASPTNMGDIFEFEAGDEFHLLIDLRDIKKSIIIKNREDPPDNFSSLVKTFKICEISDSGSPIHLLSQNVFIQDKLLSREWGFQIVRQSKNTYRVNGGFVICKQSGRAIFVKDYVFTSNSKDPYSEELSDRIIYLKIDYSVEIGRTKEAYQNYSFIKDVAIKGAEIIESNEEKKQVSVWYEAKEAPYSTTSGGNDGSFYIKLSPKNKAIIGNIYVTPTFGYGSSFVSSSRFPDSKPFYNVPESEVQAGAPPAGYVLFGGDGTKIITLDRLVEIILDKDFEGLDPIDITALTTTKTGIVRLSAAYKTLELN